MTTGQSDPRGPVRPAPTTRPRRATYPTSGYPRTRAVIWSAALIAGGAALIVTFFFLIGVIDVVQFPYLALIALALALFFGVTMFSFNRSERRGNSRWADRERRGF
jgi:fatty acid desaturase